MNHPPNQLPNDATALVERLKTGVLDPLKRAFVGKDEIIDLLGIALVGRENLFMLGPPGTAKSALIHELGRLIDGRSFDYLLTRFTEPNELFGPFDIRLLREGELVTNTEGMLPEANLIFLDELLNANSAILNSLLMVLNERVFRRGRETRHLPSLMVVGASNRLPEEEALKALFDRFLLRVHCDYVPEDRLMDVLVAGWDREWQEQQERPPAQLNVVDILALQAAVTSVDVSTIRKPYIELVQRLRNAGMSLSDRRAVKIQRLIAASALICGRQQAGISDLWVLRYTWDTDEQREIIGGLVEETLKTAENETQVHPRANEHEAPDAEFLAREIDRIVQHVLTAGESDLTVSHDRLTAIASQVEWLKNDLQREQINDRLAEAWKQLNPPAANS